LELADSLLEGFGKRVISFGQPYKSLRWMVAKFSWAAIHQAIVGLTNKIALFPNMPALNQPQLAQKVQQLLK
jgi:hypothetical protein